MFFVPAVPKISKSSPFKSAPLHIQPSLKIGERNDRFDRQSHLARCCDADFKSWYPVVPFISNKHATDDVRQYSGIPSNVSQYR